MGLSISNLIVSIGIAFDSQLKAADNLFFAAAIDFTDPTKPMFGGTVGTISGSPTTLTGTNASAPQGFASTQNPITGQPVTVRQISTAEGPRYQVVDEAGREIKAEAQSTNGTYRNVPRYVVKSDGVVYDLLAPENANGSGNWKICDPTNTNGQPPTDSPTNTTPRPGVGAITLDHYARPIGRITFKAKEGATIARAQDDLQRTGSIVQLLTRLLESIQDEAKGFSSLIR